MRRVEVLLLVATVLVAGAGIYLAVFTHALDATMTPVGRCDSATLANVPPSDSADVHRLCQQARH